MRNTPQMSQLAAILALSFVALATAAPPVIVKPSLVAQPSAGVGIYDGPQTSSDAKSTWQILTSNPIIGIEVAHIPGTDAYLYVGRRREYGFTQPSQDIIAGVFNLASKTFQNVTVISNLFCGGLTPTHDGKVFLAGGTGQEEKGVSQPDGMKGLRLYDYKADSLTIPEINSINQKRWYPTTTLMPDNSILINGGTMTGAETGTPSKTFERWNPRTPKAAVPEYPYDGDFYQQAGKIFYPSVFVLPTGEAFMLQDSVSRILKNDNTFRKWSNGSYVAAPAYPAQWKTQFPRMGTSIMTPLTYENGYSTVDIVMFGGAPTSNQCINDGSAKTIPANPYSYRLTISWRLEKGEWIYTFGPNWVEELMGIPRVGGDAVLLPNGDAVLVGGAQTGCSCGIVKGINRGNNPALWAMLYQTGQPTGQRYTHLAASSVARIYHGSAALTTDGAVLVQGCDACKGQKKDDGGVVSTAAWYSPSDVRFEYRVELFSPPYFLDTLAKPKITSVQGSTADGSVIDIAYGQTFTFTWEPLDATQTDIKVTNVSLVAPSAATHSVDANQRVVFLQIVKQQVATKTVTVQVPGNIAILPPQIYQLFIMNGKTYGRAWWVKLSGVPAT